MKKFLNCLCYPFYICCPCLETSSAAKTKTIKRNVSHKEKIGENKKSLNTELWAMKNDSQLTPSQIKDKDLTREFIIPQHYPTVEACLRDQHMDLKSKIGSGTSGKVHKAIVDGSLMACKIIQIGGYMRKKQDFENLKAELYIMSRLEHKNIVHVLNHFIIKDEIRHFENCYVIVEFANGGTVLDRMGRSKTSTKIQYKGLTEMKAKNYFSQIAKGLEYLHLNKIAHKDLKLDNIVVFVTNDSECLKITDFGLSRVRYDSRRGVVMREETGNVGTVEYMSPQIFKVYVYTRYGLKLGKLKQYDPFIADCWALGVCLYIMICAKFPFDSAQESEESVRQTYDDMRYKRYRITAKIKKKYTKHSLDLIEQLLEPMVTKRLTIQFVVSHKWLKDSNIE